MAKKELATDATTEAADSVATNTPQLVKHGPMVAAPTTADTPELATAPIVNRGGKKITPITPNSGDAAASDPFDTIPTDDEKAAASEQSVEDVAEDSKPEAADPKANDHTSVKKLDDTQPDPQAVEDNADDAAPDAGSEQTESSVSGTVESEMSSAEALRQAELDKLIADRTYAAPISMRKSSRAIVGSLSVVAFVLLIVLGDVWLDMGLLHVSGVPHTHFFAAKSAQITTPSPSPAAKPVQSAKTSLTKASIAALVVGLNEYSANNKGTYPAELTVANLPAVDPTLLSPPTGVTYSYKVLPAGCTTAAHTCTSFTLTATDTATHAVIASKHS